MRKCPPYVEVSWTKIYHNEEPELKIQAVPPVCLATTLQCSSKCCLWGLY